LAGFVDTKVKESDDRLRELKEETARLEAARTALVGVRRRPGRPPGSTSAQPTRRRRRASSTTARTTRARRGRRGGNTRANQALELVRSRPGISIPDIASAMGIEPNYLYRVMPRLVAEGQVKRDGQGWHPAS
jgi:hypothetical protein